MKRPNEFDRFVEVLEKNNAILSTHTPLAISVARDYVASAGKLAALYTAYCNRGLTAREETRMAELESHCKRLSVALGFGYVLNHDPRGCTLKLVLPSGQTNDFCSEGYCVPIKGGF